MPLNFNQVRGKPVGLYLALLALNTSAEPTPVSVTVGAGGAAAGANLIPINDPTVLIPKNTVLTFTGNVTVVVTADFPAGAAGNLAVEAFEGEEGAGLPAALLAADTAAFDRLYTVSGTEDSPYSNNPTTNNLSAVTYGGSSGISVDNPEITKIAPQIARSGLYIAEGQLTKDLIQWADSNRVWYAKQVVPDADGLPWFERKGPAKVTDFQEPKPAGDLIRLSYNIKFTAKPLVTFY